MSPSIRVRLGKPVDQASDRDVKEQLRIYWREMAERLAMSEAELFSVLNPLTVVSEFEVPATPSFIATASRVHGAKVAGTLRALVGERAVVELAPSHPTGEPYHLLPHARLAGIHRGLWVEDDFRQSVLLAYFKTEPLIGSLACGLAAGEPRTLWSLSSIGEGGLLKRDMSQMPLHQLSMLTLAPFLAWVQELPQMVMGIFEEVAGDLREGMSPDAMEALFR